MLRPQSVRLERIGPLGRRVIGLARPIGLVVFARLVRLAVPAGSLGDVVLSVMREKRRGDQALFAFAASALALISEQVYDVFAVMLLWGGQPLW